MQDKIIANSWEDIMYAVYEGKDFVIDELDPLNINANKYNVSNLSEIISIDENSILLESGTNLSKIVSELSKNNKVIGNYIYDYSNISILELLSEARQNDINKYNNISHDEVLELKVIINNRNYSKDDNDKVLVYITRDKKIGEYEYEFEKDIVSLLLQKVNVLEPNKMYKDKMELNIFDIIDYVSGTYNLKNLFLGSGINVGIIAEATLKIREAPKYNKIIIISVTQENRIDKIEECISESNPLYVSDYNNQVYSLAKTHMKLDADRLYYTKDNILTYVTLLTSDDEEELDVRSKTLCGGLTLLGCDYKILHDADEMHACFNILKNSKKLLLDYDISAYKAKYNNPKLKTLNHEELENIIIRIKSILGKD